MQNDFAPNHFQPLDAILFQIQGLAQSTVSTHPFWGRTTPKLLPRLLFILSSFSFPFSRQWQPGRVRGTTHPSFHQGTLQYMAACHRSTKKECQRPFGFPKLIHLSGWLRPYKVRSSDWDDDNTDDDASNLALELCVGPRGTEEGEEEQREGRRPLLFWPLRKVERADT